jgi:hypothetical protein
MSIKHKKPPRSERVHFLLKPFIPRVPRDPEAPRELHNRRATDRAWNSSRDVIELLPKVDFTLTAAGAMKDYLRRVRLQYAQLAVFQTILDEHPEYRNAKEHKLLCQQADRAAREIEQIIKSDEDGVRLAVLPSRLNQRHEELVIERQYEPQSRWPRTSCVKPTSSPCA